MNQMGAAPPAAVAAAITKAWKGASSKRAGRTLTLRSHIQDPAFGHSLREGSERDHHADLGVPAALPFHWVSDESVERASTDDY